MQMSCLTAVDDLLACGVTHFRPWRDGLLRHDQCIRRPLFGEGEVRFVVAYWRDARTVNHSERTDLS